MTIDFAAFDVITFDCYGTLIDWESGIQAAMAPILAAHGISRGADETLALFGELESAVEAGEYVEYRVVLRRVLEGFGRCWGFSPSSAEIDAFIASVGEWPAFPDTPGALRALGTRYRLVVISNVDDDLFVGAARRLAARFDDVVTAQQVRAYKPSPRNFLRAVERCGVPPARMLHVAQSLYHDIGPARRLGLATVWVNRRHGQPGVGATPAANAEFDLEVRDLRELVERMGIR